MADDRLTQLQAKLAASQGRPGHEQRIIAIEAEIARLFGEALEPIEPEEPSEEE